MCGFSLISHWWGLSVNIARFSQYIKIIEERQKSLYKKLIDDMKQFPLKAKRTVAEFNLNLDCGLGKSSKSKIAETIKIY